MQMDVLTYDMTEPAVAVVHEALGGFWRHTPPLRETAWRWRWWSCWNPKEKKDTAETAGEEGMEEELGRGLPVGIIRGE